jgi:nitrite reductase/ring-hydroxylating ferredoxin subunit
MDTDFDETFLAECERDLEARWVLVGTEGQLAGPESWFVYESAGRSVVVCRDASGTLGAFVNACTHRGTRLCRGSGTGRLQCPYHGWVFGCDGRLLGASRRAGFPAFDDADFGLRRLTAASVGRLLFVHGAPEPEPGLRDRLGDVAASLEALGEPARIEETVLPIGWREALAALGSAPIGVNLALLRDGSATLLVTFTPLGPERTRRLSRLYLAGNALSRWAAARRLRRAVNVSFGNRPAGSP